MYTSHHSPHISSDAKDLMFMGSFFLVVVPWIVASSVWAREGDASQLRLNFGAIWYRLVVGLMDFLFAGVAIMFGTRVIVDVVRLAGWAAA